MPDDYRYFLSRDWDLPNRAARIGELLDATPLQSPAASAAIQADTLSIAARRLVPLMTRIVPSGEPGNDLAREAVERLQAWDFRMDADMVEPLLFTAWLREFSHGVFSRRLGEAAADYWDLKPQIMETVLTTHQEWCADPKQPPESCDELLSATLDAALAGLQRAYGPEMVQWQWAAPVARFASPVFSRTRSRAIG